ncbi:MAG: MBL fold metallo-hydrolase [Ruminococcaceae bacterium]|nr:MBL fold metallo-hydrolase [Oscillospiraceae bacterium]
MKITFLGTADVRPRSDANCSSTMLEIGESIYLVDAGAPVNELLLQRGKNPECIKGIFITHGHSDHFEGLVPLLTRGFYVYGKASMDIVFPNEAQAQALRQCCSAFHHGKPFPSDRLRFVIPAENEAAVMYDDGVLKATYIPVSPYEGTPHFAILIEAEGKAVLFTGDLSEGLKDNDFPKVAFERHLELIVCEYAHVLAEHLDPCIEKCLAEQICFNHYAGWRRDELSAVVSDPKYKIPLRAVRDGDELVL